MFTQKAALFILGVGLIGLVLLYTKQIKLSDCLLSAMLPLSLYALFLAFLYKEGVFSFYFRANFELNSHIPDVFDTRRFIHPSKEMMVPIFLSIISLVYSVYKGNIYIKLSASLFCLEYIIRMYYFTPFLYYFAMLHVLASILGAVVCYQLIEKRTYLVGVVITYFLALGIYYGITYSKRITVGDSYKYGAAGFVLDLTNPCDYIVNGYRIGYNLFGKDFEGVWNLRGQIDVIADDIGLVPLSNLEAQIRKYRPKIIYGENYHYTYREYRGDIGKYVIHPISKHMLNELYIPLNRDNLYILKPEYQSTDCRYNPRTKTYEYYDFK